LNKLDHQALSMDLDARDMLVDQVSVTRLRRRLEGLSDGACDQGLNLNSRYARY
jgi:hypothetical protein